MDGQSHSVATIIAACWPHWRAEFMIGFAAFSADNVYREPGWLAAQIWKEWTGSGVYGPRGTDLGSALPGENAAEERAHFDALRALVPLMEGRCADYRPGAAAQALADYRHRHWADPALSHGVRMSEGGGLGLFHGAIAAIDARAASRAQDGPVRATLQGIIADEAGHLGGAIRAFLAARIDEAGPVLRVLDHCLALKVAERRAQFAPQLASDTPPDEPRIAAYRDAIAALLGEGAPSR